jgi:hypothetical protein
VGRIARSIEYVAALVIAGGMHVRVGTGPPIASHRGALVPRSVLTLACPACGESFESALAMEPSALLRLRVRSVIERCPSCREASRFRKDDYFFAPPPRGDGAIHSPPSGLA